VTGSLRAGITMEDEMMGTRHASNGRYTIVVGVDFEADGDMALDTAIDMATRVKDGEVHVVHVKRAQSLFPPSDDGPISRKRNPLDLLDELCDERVQIYELASGHEVLCRLTTHLRIGRASRQIVELAAELDADLIVVGTHNRRGVRRLILGSTAERVAHTARCPVLVARHKDHEDAGLVPEVEPPCPDCLTEQRDSGDPTTWCARHALAVYHPRAHRVSVAPGPGDGDPASQRRAGTFLN